MSKSLLLTQELTVHVTACCTCKSLLYMYRNLQSTVHASLVYMLGPKSLLHM